MGPLSTSRLPPIAYHLRPYPTISQPTHWNEHCLLNSPLPRSRAGTNIKADLRMLQSPPSVLVATPGRLNDLLYNYDKAQLFCELRILIFDEACPSPAFTFFSHHLNIPHVISRPFA